MSANTELTWVAVAASDEIPDGEARTFTVAGAQVAVARAEGTVYAIQDVCSHDDGPLGAGRLDGFAIQCPRHGAKFDVRTGAVLSMPAIVGVGTFGAREEDGKILVAVPETSAASTDDW